MFERKFDKHPIYNINSVIRETGIKEDTLRAWERRYDLPKPDRSKGGHRLFSEFDIETIKWLLERQSEGMRISQAVELWRQKESESGFTPLQQFGMDQASIDKTTNSLEKIKTDWLRACLLFDEEESDSILRQAFARFPVEDVCLLVLQAGLADMGMLWYTGNASVQQEHFASEVATRQVQSLIFAAPRPIRSETVLIGSAQGESHVFSLLLITLLLKYRGWNVIYLGASVPYHRLKETISSTKPDLVIGASFQLSTTTELFEFGRLVEELKVRFAYGGRIFNIHPSLREKFPGAFLGESVEVGIVTAEACINEPYWIQSDWKTSGIYENLFIEFNDKYARIELETLKNIHSRIQVKLSNEIFNNASTHLSKDILSALAFEDLDLLRAEANWVEDLLRKENLSTDLLKIYFEAYKKAIEDVIGDAGSVLVEWINALISDI